MLGGRQQHHARTSANRSAVRMFSAVNTLSTAMASGATLRSAGKVAHAHLEAWRPHTPLRRLAATLNAP